MPRQWTLGVAVLLLATSVIVLPRSSSSQEGTASAASKTQVKNTPAPYTPPSSGKGMYLAYCASCHGKEGKGDGPAAPSLKCVPTDLTQLAAANGGTFPESHVIQTIKGDSLTSGHGSKDMPVWGPIFRAMGTTSDGVAQLRVRNLTKYIASMQQK